MTYNTAHASALFMVFLLTLNSCSSDFNIGSEETQEPESPATVAYYNVDERLWPYFESFEKEAALRNISIDLNEKEITGEIKNIPEEGVAGTCRYGLHIHHVTIDISVWNRSSSAIREMIIYHELGHCVLGRGHKETSNNNGVCLSIMNSGTTSCNVAYNTRNKAYYIDELFSDD